MSYSGNCQDLAAEITEIDPGIMVRFQKFPNDVDENSKVHPPTRLFGLTNAKYCEAAMLPSVSCLRASS